MGILDCLGEKDGNHQQGDECVYLDKLMSLVIKVTRKCDNCALKCYLQVEGQVRDKKGHARPQHPQRPQPRLLVIRLAPAEAAGKVKSETTGPNRSNRVYGILSNIDWRAK